MFFYKNRLLFSWTWIRKTKYIVMMTKEGSTIVVSVMAPEAGVLVLDRGHNKSYSENAFFFKRSSSLISRRNLTN